MNVTLTTTKQELQFEVRNAYATIEVGANVAISETEKTFRPMELLLASLASCSAIDILSILKKQRQVVAHFEISVSGLRAESIPAVFEKIELEIRTDEGIDVEKLQKAITLTTEKYCSVYRMLAPSCEIIYTHKIVS